MGNEMAMFNRKALLCYEVISSVLGIAYLAEVFKGTRSITYILIFYAILFIPMAITVITYRKNNSSEAVKHFLSLGYGVLYAFVLLTSVSSISFVYIIPMLMVITVYHDPKYSFRVGVAAILINLVYINVFYIQHKDSITKHDSSNFEIQICCLLLVVIFSNIATKTINSINEQQISKLKSEERRQREMLSKIIETTATVCDKIEVITEESGLMAQQSENSQIAVKEIAEGTSEIATTIQNQLKMTSQITTLTSNMAEITTQVSEKCQVASETTEVGTKDMESLLDASRTSRDACEVVAGTMKDLVSKTEEVKGILDMIARNNKSDYIT